MFMVAFSFTSDKEKQNIYPVCFVSLEIDR